MPRVPPISLRLNSASRTPRPPWAEACGPEPWRRPEPGEGAAPPWAPKPGEGAAPRPHRHNHPIYASDPLSWTRRFLKFFPDPIQAEVLQATDPRLLLNCTRQWGKSTIIAAKALHFAIFHPKTTTLIAAPSERQSLILRRRLQTFIEPLAIHSAPVPSIPFSVRLPNGSEIIALPASPDTVRGFTAHLLILDEAARIPDPLIHVLSPARATTNGPFWLLSTPNGPTGFFYDAWHENFNREQRESGSAQSFNREQREPGSDQSTNREQREPGSDQPINREQRESGSAPSWRRFRVPASDWPRITEPYLITERLIFR